MSTHTAEKCRSRSNYSKCRRGSIADLTRAVRSGRYVLIHLPKHLPDPVSQFVDSVNLFDHVLEIVGHADMVAFNIHNEVNQSGTPIGLFSDAIISYRQMQCGACLTIYRSLTLD